MTKPFVDLQSLRDKIHSCDLPSLFSRYPQIKLLSLDCFDTLLWRKTATPVDLFFALQHKPAFKQLGINTAFRQAAESRARQMKALTQNTNEVTLNEIYLEHDHTLTPEELATLAENELQTEIEYCHAFPPIVDLIQTAHANNIKVVIVSDTYFNENQLRQLLATALPANVLHMISAIFCSCEYKRSKLNGLFYDVLAQNKIEPQQILHLGDNYSADYIAPRALSINALHFIAQDEQTIEISRLQALVNSVFDAKTRTEKPLLNPLSGIHALNAFQNPTPEKTIGFTSLGPIMFAFAKFILDEQQRLKEKYTNVKTLFLMRDAHLPLLACNTLMGVETGKRIHISRFSAQAAAFRSIKDIQHYLISLGKSDRYHDIAKQLLLSEIIVTPIINKATKTKDPELEFARLVTSKEISRIILKKSSQYRERLINYLKKEIGLTKGDTLLLIDLGYSATVQKHLTHAFSDSDIRIEGRYLISLNTQHNMKCKRGLLDISFYDEKTLFSLVGYIAILEQLCTSNENSVIDYDEEGNALYSDVGVQKSQHNQLQLIHDECLRFIRTANYFNTQIMNPLTWQELRSTVLAEIGRISFLPTKAELTYLQQFQFDLNLGTKDIYRLFDPENGLAGLRKRGLFFMEKNSKKMRTNYPAELRAASFELAMTSMVQNRFNLDIKLQDMLPRQEKIACVLMHGNAIDEIPLEATATHDGYFSIWAPAGTGVKFLFGKHYAWLEIESAELIAIEDFIHQRELGKAEDISTTLHFSNVLSQAKNLLHCTSPQSFIGFQTQQRDTTQHIVRIVFRPIVRTKQEEVVL